jgi:hypothetical protein
VAEVQSRLVGGDRVVVSVVSPFCEFGHPGCSIERWAELEADINSMSEGNSLFTLFPLLMTGQRFSQVPIPTWLTDPACGDSSEFTRINLESFELHSVIGDSDLLQLRCSSSRREREVRARVLCSAQTNNKICGN